MDISKTYIDMSIKALELQKEKDFRYVNFYKPVDSEGFDIFIDGSGNFYINHNKTKFQLYRQDQLQELMADKIGRADAIGVVWELYAVVGPNRTGYYATFNSMEQLWLAYVMKEKYNKEWGDEEWKLIK